MAQAKTSITPLQNCLSWPSHFPRTLIDRGATVPSTINGLQWILDTGYITSGTSKNLPVPVLYHTLSTVRSFPLQNNIRRKFCHVVNVFRGAKYMVRSTYLYGGINGNDSPPELMEHSSVANTTEDYRDSMSWLEGRLRVSVGVNLVARHSFIHNERIRYPDDHFDRVWEPFGANNSTIPSSKNVYFCGLLVVLRRLLLTPATGSSIDLLIDVGEVFDVIALKNTYKRCVRLVQVVLIYNFNVGGIGVGFIIELCFEFVTSIDSTVFMGFLFVGAVIALEALKSSFQNAPLDCNGNPCMPRQFSWTGIACFEGPRIRVVTLNLTNLGLSGSLLNAARLTALTGMGEAFGRQPIH
ncbi:hypothetical protein OIU79_004248 [Salix purpurea]|uniref:Malectin-like domain-containing protein n=1 Tax=Salix purpurea TaxID=77065 RepID=A0A9Q0U9X7_SALPP|nr:hypothetical protein OIU79_004248 [Salix purpurea]